MKREIKTIKLSNCEVDIYSAITWYERTQLEGSMADGVILDNEGVKGYVGDALLKSTIKAMEICIQGIREGEKKKAFSLDWLKSLSQEDGDALYSAIDEITTKKK